jgi:hypothetical protein
MARELDTLSEVSRCSDAELVCRLQRLVAADRRLSAKLLEHLGEVDARGLYRDLGYSSMFEYTVTALCMSEAEAYLRIQAARLGRRFPVVIERVGAGALHLTAIKLLAPHLTADNHVHLLERVQGKSKREVERLVAELAPKPDVPERMRRLPNARAELGCANGNREAPTTSPNRASELAATQTLVHTDMPLLAAHATPPAIVSGSAARRTAASLATLVPLAPARFKLELTIGQDAHDKLEQLRELLRHQNPSGDLARIIEVALSELLDRTMQKRFARTSIRRTQAAKRARSRKRAPACSPEASRSIPRAVVREVHERDGGQCTFVSPEGRRCTARGFLELHHHVTTYARGGAATADNLRLTCRAHNALLAERDYGRNFMRAKLLEAAANRQRPGHSIQNVKTNGPSA